MRYKDCGAIGRSGVVFLGIFFALGSFCVIVSAQRKTWQSANARVERPAREFQDRNLINKSTTAADVSDTLPERRLNAQPEFFSLSSVPDDSAVSVYRQTDRVETSADGPKDSKMQFRKVIPYGEQRIVLISDQQERVEKTLYRATGNVVITFLDMILTCDEAEYDEETLHVSTRGETWFRQEKVSLTSSGVAFDFEAKAVILHDVSGYFYETSGRSDREFFLTGGMVQNIKADKLQINWGAKEID